MITKATSPRISPSEGPRGGSSGGSPSSVVALELSVEGCQPRLHDNINNIYNIYKIRNKNIWIVLVQVKVESLPRVSLRHLPPVFWSAVVKAVSPVSKSNVAEWPCISYCTRWVVFRGQ